MERVINFILEPYIFIPCLWVIYRIGSRWVRIKYGKDELDRIMKKSTIT